MHTRTFHEHESRLQIQHAPLPMRHVPTEEVAVQGADMLARSVLLLQSHKVLAHIVTVRFPCFAMLCHAL
jgi:hypothetical protein